MVERYDPVAVVVDTGGLGKKIAEEIRMRHGLPLRAAEKSEKFAHIEVLNDALRSGRFYVKADSRFARDALLVEWDREKSTSDRLVVSDRYHSDVCDAVLYAFRESQHWMHVPEQPKPAAGTMEALIEEERTHEDDLSDAVMAEHNDDLAWERSGAPARTCLSAAGRWSPHWDRGELMSPFAADGSRRSRFRRMPGHAIMPPDWRSTTFACLRMPSTIGCGTRISSPPPACARICTSHAFCRMYMKRKASATVSPHVSSPWLRRIIECLSPRSRTSRAFSSGLSATPS